MRMEPQLAFQQRDQDAVNMYTATLERDPGSIQDKDEIAQLQSHYQLQKNQVRMQLQAEYEQKARVFLADSNAKERAIKQ